MSELTLMLFIPSSICIDVYSILFRAMETVESKGKKRVLPEWMKEENVGTNISSTKNLKRKKENSSPKRLTVYCMNERELVACALEILSEEKRRNASDMAAITEASEDQQSGESQATSPANQTSSPEVVPSTSKAPTVPETDSDSDDDALRLIREIFFT
ncbi:hypothetical protein XENTR_v10007672 [Xenopus tropicalis]|uniref:Cell cycle regulator of non-homologous end joining n=1 Tax=Xenopus tropicalis TaxID=8364 RepID=A0A8J0QXC7_XENTR|nr:cell cycle regulator of non-homologous end joining [Xenopus tropicalis]KAE8613335.1 hypothetical protein XENTR_v10007672 [Xenopus tropicalis]KAE8613336.1 hypothetical protein XENTR_v10007672 [Xenopus tropicalis]KAE8613337.1 hypothetical protein XENTR_v10007672 [Xenopus tropicalis]